MAGGIRGGLGRAGARARGGAGRRRYHPRAAVRHGAAPGFRAARHRAHAQRRARRGCRCSSRGTPGDAAAGLALEQWRLQRAGRAAALAARALPLSHAARGARRAAARIRERLHRCLRWPARRCRQARQASGCGVESGLRRRCRCRQPLRSAVGRGACARARADRRRRLRAVLHRAAGENLAAFTHALPPQRLGVPAHRRAARRAGRGGAARRDCDAVLAFAASSTSAEACVRCTAHARPHARAARGGSREGCITVARRREPLSSARLRLPHAAPCQYRLQNQSRSSRSPSRGCPTRSAST